MINFAEIVCGNNWPVIEHATIAPTAAAIVATMVLDPVIAPLFVFQDQLMYTCNEGYTFFAIAPVITTCLIDRSWSPVAATCQGKINTKNDFHSQTDILTSHLFFLLTYNVFLEYLNDFLVT